MNYASIVPLPAIRLARFVLGFRVKSYRQFASFVRNKVGLEIGGPSGPFRDSGILPLYRLAGKIDDCNFSSVTIWGTNHKAKSLETIPASTYDFVLASHVLEHCANPLKTIQELRRVGKPDAAFVVILPHYAHSFDHRRQTTPISHLVADYKLDVAEDDMTHLEEILELHDLTRDPEAGTPEQFAARCRNNLAIRAMHHHVFNEDNACAMLETAGLQVQVVEFVRPHHIVLLAYRIRQLVPR